MRKIDRRIASLGPGAALPGAAPVVAALPPARMPRAGWMGNQAAPCLAVPRMVLLRADRVIE